MAAKTHFFRYLVSEKIYYLLLTVNCYHFHVKSKTRIVILHTLTMSNIIVNIQSLSILEIF